MTDPLKAVLWRQSSIATTPKQKRQICSLVEQEILYLRSPHRYEYIGAVGTPST